MKATIRLFAWFVGIWALSGPAICQAQEFSFLWDRTPSAENLSVELDALFLARDETDGTIVAALNSRGQVGRPDVLASEEVHFDLESGFRIAAQAALTERQSVEAVYFGINDWTGDRASITRPENSGLRITAASLAAQNFATRVSASGESELHNGELNLRHRLRDCSCTWQTTLITGFRFIHFGDQFDVFALVPEPGPATATEQTSVETDNYNIGLQLGGVLDWHVKNFTLSASVKGLMFANTYDSVATNTLNDPNGFFRPGQTRRVTQNDDSDVEFGVGADIGIQGAYWVTDQLSVRAGYHLLVLSNQALGSQQLPGIAVAPALGANTPNRLSETTDALFHGPSFGIVYDW